MFSYYGIEDNNYWSKTHTKKGLHKYINGEKGFTSDAAVFDELNTICVKNF